MVSLSEANYNTDNFLCNILTTCLNFSLLSNAVDVFFVIQRLMKDIPDITQWYRRESRQLRCLKLNSNLHPRHVLLTTKSFVSFTNCKFW